MLPAVCISIRDRISAMAMAMAMAMVMIMAVFIVMVSVMVRVQVRRFCRPLQGKDLCYCQFIAHRTEEVGCYAKFAHALAKMRSPRR